MRMAVRTPLTMPGEPLRAKMHQPAPEGAELHGLAGIAPASRRGRPSLRQIKAVFPDQVMVRPCSFD
jgi:hypothetical protein